MAVWSEVRLSDLPGARRLDAEFWQPSYLENERLLCQNHHTMLKELVSTFRKGIFYILASEYVDMGIPFYRSANVQSIIPNNAGLTYITEERNRIEAKTSLSRGDLMLAKTGKHGASVVLCNQCNVSQDVIAVRVKREKVNPFFLAVYLNTRIGQLELQRWFQGQVQEHLSLPDAQRVIVPLLNDTIQQQAQTFVEQAEAALEQSHHAYVEAEETLESALQQGKPNLSPQLFYERSYADVSAVARFDAEYFQPPKRDVLAALAKMPGESIGEQYQSVRELWQPDRVRAHGFVRNYDLTDALQPYLDESVEPTPPDIIASTKKRLKPGDLVVSRLRSYLKEIAVVLDTGSVPMVGSTEFIVLRPQKSPVRVEALLVYLRSRYIQTVLKWCQDGSNHPRFDEKELLALRVPDVVREHQEEIAAKVQEAIRAKRAARRRLDEATTIVERAILEDR